MKQQLRSNNRRLGIKGFASAYLYNLWKRAQSAATSCYTPPEVAGETGVRNPLFLSSVVFQSRRHGEFNLVLALLLYVINFNFDMHCMFAKMVVVKGLSTFKRSGAVEQKAHKIGKSALKAELQV
ncbi:hypothetical protein Tco_0964224 [Tanacetum coccineum]